MDEATYNTIVIFGGAGFIGSHMAELLLTDNRTQKVYLVDIQPPGNNYWTDSLQRYKSESDIVFIEGDVRQELNITDLPDTCDLIVNLAAIHRQPGHKPEEYFETNIYGAENICNWALKSGCQKIIFTSSISTYGPTEEIKDENSLTVPTTPYGSSKLVAEKIHIAWQNINIENHRLVIVRPGVVFGPGEGGNVTRLINSVLDKYFFYMGNKNTVKAGGYVKELVRSMLWVLQNQDKNYEKISLFNFTFYPIPSIKDYVNTIHQVAGVKWYIPTVPFIVFWGISLIISPIAKLLRINQPVNPIRLKKLVHSNNIIPNYLIRKGYQFKYSLIDAMVDWRNSYPNDWKV